MNINDISTEKLVGMTLLQNTLKSQLGDGMEFELVYQALLNSMEGQEGNKDESSNLISVGVGQDLNNIPIRYSSGINSSTYSIGAVNKVSTISDDETMQRIYSAVNKYSEEFGVDPNLVLAVIKAESNFNPNVVSSAGAIGLMQLMPVNCEEDGVSDPFNVEDNIRGGVKQLRGHINRYNGDIEMALMAYNAGQGTVKRRGVTSADDLYKMPKETQNYVPKVMKYYLNGL